MMRIDGRDLYYRRSGSGKKAVVFIHGFTCDYTDWRKQIDHLAPYGDMEALDLNGHGRSAVDLTTCTIDGFAEDIITLLERLDLAPVTVIGHRMGCRVTLQALSRRPDLFTAGVLVDGSRSCTPESLDGVVSQTRTLLDAGGYREIIRQRFDQMFLNSSEPALKQAIVQRALALPEPVGDRIAMELFRWDALGVEAALGAIKAPVLVVQTNDETTEGRRQTLKPGDRNAWLDLLSRHIDSDQLEIAIIPDAGHFPMLERPAELNRLLEGFLKKQTVL